MIHAKDLMIGNNIFHEGEIKKVNLKTIIFAVEDNKKFNEVHKPIPLTPDVLEKCGFVVDVWSRISLGLSLVGEDGSFNLVLGRCATSDGLPYAVLLEQQSNDGFTIQQAAEIQNERNEIDDEAFLLKKKSSVCLPPIKYLHQLQNLFYSLTNTELEFKQTEK